jgi:hemoglobin
MDESAVYGVIGEEGFERLAAAFYRHIPNDPILGPMYPAEDLVGAEQRLRDFLVGRFGGPPRYIQERGHPRLRARHMPFVVDQAARDRWMVLMTGALEEAQLRPDAAALLHEFFAAMSQFLINRG